MPELDEARTPASIEQRSFDIIDAELPDHGQFPGELWEVARRCIHALGDTAILGDLRLSDGALNAGVAALGDKCVVYTDTAMLAAGLVARRMEPLGVRVVPVMALPGINERAQANNCTRARAGMELIAPHMGGQIVAIGNAPTALLTLMELLRQGAPAPALIVGMPVGFVNAAQSKELLTQGPWNYFTLLGRKGGSAAAAACVNALAEITLRQRR